LRSRRCRASNAGGTGVGVPGIDGVLVGEGNRGGLAEDGAAEFEEMGEDTSAVTRGWAGVGAVWEVTEVTGEADAEAWG
jgi:hypothetical protein